MTGFSEGSINVFFFIIRIELVGFLPTVAEILADIRLAIVVASGIDGTIGEFEIDEESVKISKLIDFPTTFFSLKNINLGACFLVVTLFENFNF